MEADCLVSVLNEPININVAGAAAATRRGRQDCEQMEIIIDAEDSSITLSPVKGVI